MDRRTFVPRRGLSMALLATSSVWAVAPALADVVTDWNTNAGAVAQAACISPAPDPFHESRLYAMLHIAIHDALNAIQRRSTAYAYAGLAPAGASVDASAASAAHAVLVSELPKLPALFAACTSTALQLADGLYQAAIAAIPDGQAKTDGIAVGAAAAAAIIALRSADGSEAPFADFAFPQGTQPGEWRFTEIPFAAATSWSQVTTFGLDRADRYMPNPPYPVQCGVHEANASTGSCKLYARDLEDVKNYGGAGTNLRTADETQVALFWVESSPLGWNRMARTVSPQFGFDPWQNARLFALLNMGLADGYVASAHTKYHYRFWRPETAVRLADEDGNPYTSGQPDWTPLAAPTPPVPDYESAHSVAGAVSAEVFRRVFGADQVDFEACSLTLPVAGERCGGVNEVRRRYSSFSQAAAENGRSRVLCGYHFQNAVTKGLEHGRRIGADVVKHHLQPTS